MPLEGKCSSQEESIWATKSTLSLRKGRIVGVERRDRGRRKDKPKRG